MNLPVAQNPNLPAHLQGLAGNAALMALNTSAAAGISSGGWPRISIKAARFRLQQPQGEELVVPQLHLDVIIVDANPHGVSKRYYAAKYDTNSEGEAPDCYSDNGVGPSSKSAKPQCGTCAACPHNVWGSKISEASGKPTRACSDLKKVAVLIADNTSGPVFELDIPAASMATFAQFVKSLDKHGVPLPTVITRLTFDPGASFPKLLFAPAFTAQGQLPYITQEQLQDVMEVVGTEEVDNCTGKNDVPVDPARVAIAAPVAQPAPLTPQPQYGAAPQPVNPPVAVLHAAPDVGVFPGAQAAPTGAPAAPSTDTPTAPPVVKRTRKAKAPDEAQPLMLPPAPPVAVPAFLQSVIPVAQAANATAPLAPTGVTSAALDDMIAAAMRV